MNLKLTVLMLFIFNQIASAQISVAKGGVFFAKEFSKETSLYRAKTFVIEEIINKDGHNISQFKLDPLVASTSGELTTLVYKCESINKTGLILGFYGDRWNDAGVVYQSYAFKNLPIDEANEFISRIEQASDSSYKFMAADNDNNNIYLTYKDIGVLMYYADNGIKLRIYWNGFDSEWKWSEFAKTEKRLGKKLK